MGALHAGHLSLIESARRKCEDVIVTVFVNARQFSDAADLAAYPRQLERDAAAAESAGATLVVAPSAATMWPVGTNTLTTVHVAHLGDRWEGADRPGHFDGVTSVVAKLFAVTGSCTAFFGEKDFQQLVIVQQMVRDLDLGVTVIGCPIVRDDDGLALSSRNLRLTGDGRRTALALSRSVRAAMDACPAPTSELRRVLLEHLEFPGITVHYADVVDPTSLEPLSDHADQPARALVAASVEGVRLLDNGPVTARPS